MVEKKEDRRHAARLASPREEDGLDFIYMLHVGLRKYKVTLSECRKLRITGRTNTLTKR